MHHPRVRPRPRAAGHTRRWRAGRAVQRPRVHLLAASIPERAVVAFPVGEPERHRSHAYGTAPILDSGELSVTRVWRMRREESGVTLVLFALLLVALSVLVAFVVDLGPVYTERRQDQSGADGAALAGAQAVRAGQSLSGAVMAVARANLRTQYSGAQCTTLRQGCTDPG